MKKLTLSALLLMLITGLYGEERAIGWGSYYMPGNIIPEAALSYEGYSYHGWHYNDGKSYYGTRHYGQLGLYPAAEVMLWKPYFGEYAPLDIGVEAIGRFGIPLSRYESFSMGAGAQASFHLGFRGFDFPGSQYLDRIDFFVKLGLGCDFINEDGFKMGFISETGLNYFITERFSLGLSYRHWGINGHKYDSVSYRYNGIAIQARFRLGRSGKVKGMGEVWNGVDTSLSGITDMTYLAQFYVYFTYAAYTGGYYSDSCDMQEGCGGIWRYEDGEGKEHFFIERTFLEREADGAEWWLLKYYDDQEEVLFEYCISKDKSLKTLYYRDEKGRIRSYEFKGDEELTAINSSDVVSYQDLENMASAREDVRVKAGLFKDCLHIESESRGEEEEFWYSDDKTIPGALVKFHYFDDENQELRGELYEKVKGKTGRFSLKNH